MKVLEVLGDMTINSFDFFNAFLNAGYGASIGRMEHETYKIKDDRAGRKKEAEIKQKYYNLLYKLKEDGLIKVEARNKTNFFSITGKGKEKLEKLKLDNIKRLPRPMSYSKEKGQFTIVVFDIPEKERSKRAWIREVLKNLDLKMIQKSVWVGKVKIPKQFIDDLDKFNMVDFVEIFEISKAGSLKQIN